MITVLATIKPSPLRKIRIGQKLWEMRKTSPKYAVPFRVLCCESGSHGIIKAMFICDKVVKKLPADAIAEITESCVSLEAATQYACECPLHFWHISDMEDYGDNSPYRIYDFGVSRAPQSWQYIQDKQEGSGHG